MVKGNFEASINNKIIAKGSNILTEKGKNVILKWLNDFNKENSKRQIVDFTPVNLSTSSSYYYCRNAGNCVLNDDSYTEFGNNSDNYFDSLYYDKKHFSLFCDFDEPQKIKELIMLYSTAYSSSSSSDYGVQLEFSTSTKNAADSEEKDWVVRKYARTAYNFGYQNKNEMAIFLGDRNNPEIGIENVKSIRICAIDDFIKLYQLKIIADKSSYLPPIFLGLGDGNKQPSEQDEKLGNELARFMCDKEKYDTFYINNVYDVNANGTYTKNNDKFGIEATYSNGNFICWYNEDKWCLSSDVSNTDVYVAVGTGFGNPWEIEWKNTSEVSDSEISIEYLGFNEFSVTLFCHLGIRELSQKTIREIGLYFIDDNNQSLPYKNQKLSLFSRGLFENEWIKDNNSIVKIRYTISVSE
jgi:hypothetical protein